MEDGAHQKPSGSMIQKELGLVRAADAAADLDADLRVGLTEAVHDAGNQYPVVAVALGGIHIHEAEAIAATRQQGLSDFHGLGGHALPPGARR